MTDDNIIPFTRPTRRSTSTPTAAHSSAGDSHITEAVVEQLAAELAALIDYGHEVGAVALEAGDAQLGATANGIVDTARLAYRRIFAEAPPA